MSCALEYRTDFADGRLYASRNVNDVRHTYDANGANRSSLDWNLTLRQSRRPVKTDAPPVHGPELLAASSMPDLRATERVETRLRAPLTKDHPDGPYNAATESVGKFQNYAHTAHMLDRCTRVSSGNPRSVDWQLNLRDGAHHPPDKEWRRYFTRPQLSFDAVQENCGRENEGYQRSHITPQDRRLDRLASAISHGSCREETISFRRSEGCEGTQVGQWRHLIDDKSRGHKHKRQMAYETTLRCYPGDSNGARIADNRSDGCLVEMLGKKKWSDTKYERRVSASGNINRDSNVCVASGMEDNAGPARPDDGGDAKMHHLSRSRHILPDRDEKDRGLRKTKQERKDKDISEVHPGKPRRGGGGGGDGRSDG